MFKVKIQNFFKDSISSGARDHAKIAGFKILRNFHPKNPSPCLNANFRAAGENFGVFWGANQRKYINFRAAGAKFFGIPKGRPKKILIIGGYL